MSPKSPRPDPSQKGIPRGLLEPPTIETSRLVLRPWELTDAPAIYRYRANPEIYRYMRTEPPASQDTVEESIRRWLGLRTEDRTPIWVITLKESTRVVGLVAFVELDRVHSSGRLSYEVAREQWGNGIATEAARAVLSYGFGTIGLNRIDAYCWAGNAASRRVLEKTGMRYEGTLRQFRYAKGAYRDVRLYSALTGEWKACPGVQGSPGDPTSDS